MKKLKHALYTMSALTLLAACSENDVPVPVDANGLYMESNAIPTSRSLQDAIDIVMQNMNLLDDAPNSRRGKRTIDMSKHGIKAVKRIKSRGSNAIGDTLFYVLNFENNAGYAVVAKDYAVTDPLIAITEEGYYDPEQGCDNPGLAMYMDMATDYVETQIARLPPTSGDSTGGKPIIPGIGGLDSTHHGEPLEPNPGGGNDGLVMQRTVRDTTWFVNSPAKIKLRWGQNFPEGRYCPYYICGCSNTAAAMAMSYFEWPKGIDLTFNEEEDTDIPFYTSLDWKEIKKYIKGMRKPDTVVFDPDEDVTYEISTARGYVYDDIGFLCRQLGYLNQTDYYTYSQYGAGTIMENLREGLASLGYNVSPITSNLGIFGEGIYIMEGSPRLNQFDGAPTNFHTWLVDGCLKYDIKTKFQISNDKGRTWTTLMDDTQPYYLIHINWGDYGSSNGYFRCAVLSTAQYFKLDNPSDGITLGSSGQTIEYKYELRAFEISK